VYLSGLTKNLAIVLCARVNSGLSRRALLATAKLSLMVNLRLAKLFMYARPVAKMPQEPWSGRIYRLGEELIYG